MDHHGSWLRALRTSQGKRFGGKLKVEMVVPLKTSKDQNRRQKLFLIRIKWKKVHGEVQLAGFEVYHDPKMGKRLLGGDFHLGHGKRDF